MLLIKLFNHPINERVNLTHPINNYPIHPLRNLIHQVNILFHHQIIILHLMDHLILIIKVNFIILLVNF